LIAVKLEGVYTVYEGEKKPAIKNVNLKVERGEAVVVVGPNGAGKTTLLETINGLLKPVRGEVRVFGVNAVEKGREVRKRIGYVPQELFSSPSTPYLVEQVVVMGRYGRIGFFRGVSKEDWEKARWAMELVGILDLAKRPVGKLSGGQQQKVMIARALAKEPDLLLMDEAFSNLDANSRRDIIREILELKRKGLTVITVTHDIASIPREFNRGVLMDKGRIIADKSLNMLLSSREFKEVYGFKVS